MNYKAVAFHNSGHTRILGKIATRAQIKKNIYSIFDSLMNALLFCIDFCVCVSVWARVPGQDFSGGLL